KRKRCNRNQFDAPTREVTPSEGPSMSRRKMLDGAKHILRCASPSSVSNSPRSYGNVGSCFKTPPPGESLRTQTTDQRSPDKRAAKMFTMVKRTDSAVPTKR